MLNSEQDYKNAKTGTIVKDSTRDWLKITNDNRRFQLSFATDPHASKFDGKEYWYPRAYSHEVDGVIIIEDEQHLEDRYVETKRRTDAEMAGKDRHVFVVGKGTL